MSNYTLAPLARYQPLSNSGLIIPGGLIWTYEAGTTTLTPTYTTDSGVAHTNPIVLDSAGRCSSGIYLVPGQAYKFVFEQAATPPAHGTVVWTQDDIQAVPLSASNSDILAVAGEDLIAEQCVYLSDGSGGLNDGQAYLADADNTYSSSDAAVVGFALESVAAGSTFLMRISGQMQLTGPLTAGDKYFVSDTAGALTNTSPANSRYVGFAQDATTLVISPAASSSTTASPSYLNIETFSL